MSATVNQRHRLVYGIKRRVQILARTAQANRYRRQGKRVIHFLHIGKTGGSAVKYGLTHYPPARHYAVCLHDHHVKLSDISTGDGVIFTVRDPLTRFVSGFYSRQRQGQPRYFIPWTADERRAFEYFPTADRLATAISSSAAEDRARAHSAMASIRHVKASYWRWFKSEQYFRSRLADIFFIAFQERLAEDFDGIRSKLGMPDVARLPVDDSLAHRNPGGLDKHLTDEAVANLRSWYRADFEFIALCKEVARDIS